jgi:methyl-accepting chemotaxis protein
VKELIGEIAAASNEQAEGVGQINKAMAEMDKVVQQNASNAEESASASEELSAQAAQMKSIVGDLVIVVEGSQYKIERQHGMESIRAVSQRAYVGALVAKSKTPFAQMPPRKSGYTRVVNPEQVIPLDDKEFKDF